MGGRAKGLMAAKGEETMLLMPGKKKVDKGKDVIIAINSTSKQMHSYH